MTNAKKIKSLRDGDKPFELHFERGEVIAGRDQGLAKMSIGERAKLTIAAVIGYGGPLVDHLNHGAL